MTQHLLGLISLVISTSTALLPVSSEAARSVGNALLALAEVSAAVACLETWRHRSPSYAD